MALTASCFQLLCGHSRDRNVESILCCSNACSREAAVVQRATPASLVQDVPGAHEKPKVPLLAVDWTCVEPAFVGWL